MLYQLLHRGNMLLHFLLSLCAFYHTVANNTSKPGCQTTCGNVTVPYPFGIGEDCSLIDGPNDFRVICNTSFQPPKLFLEGTGHQIYNISDSELRVFTRVTYRCYDKSGHLIDEGIPGNYYPAYFTTLSLAKNKFTVIGCDDYALVEGSSHTSFTSGCLGLCSGISNVVDGQCSGIGCCQTSIPKGHPYYHVTLDSFKNHSNVWDINQCGYGFLVEEDMFHFGGVADLIMSQSDFVAKIESTMHFVLDWVIIKGWDGNCTDAGNECQENSSCYDHAEGENTFPEGRPISGYQCKCNDGYEGNPYLDPGCQDIDECKDNGIYPCYGNCINTIGSYNCSCPQGSFGDAKIPRDCKEDAKDSKTSLTIIIIVIVCGISAIISGIYGVCLGIRRRKLTRLREKFFEQNGGLLLKQKIKSQGTHEAMTLFNTKQLRKATDNYSQEKIIGKGAYGVVYKGVLSDKRVVAIKKSKLVDVTQAEQFINEIMILTQVIHRNVVKLLGCCLEEEVPVLVYEFISNNTLFHHIHHKLGGIHWLSWENRLRVATEVASALGYLHSEITMQIIHRDVKSSNILLDENNTAKISDFGASRLIPVDHEQVTTLVQGTLGYLDPEYFKSSQLTEKSDVYSFGVVLAELITGKKPIGVDRIDEEKILATYFVNLVNENRLLEIVEPRLIRETTLEQLQTIGDLVKRCVSLVGRDRPTMKEVAMELEGMRKFSTHPWVQQGTCNETRSLVLEVEQSDHYDKPLTSGTNEWESYFNEIVLEENNPR